MKRKQFNISHFLENLCMSKFSNLINDLEYKKSRFKKLCQDEFFFKKCENFITKIIKVEIRFFNSKNNFSNISRNIQYLTRNYVNLKSNFLKKCHLKIKEWSKISFFIKYFLKKSFMINSFKKLKSYEKLQTELDYFVHDLFQRTKVFSQHKYSERKRSLNIFLNIIKWGSLFLNSIEKILRLDKKSKDVDSFESSYRNFKIKKIPIFLPMSNFFFWKYSALYNVFFCPIIKTNSSNSGYILSCGHILSSLSSISIVRYYSYKKIKSGMIFWNCPCCQNFDFTMKHLFFV